MSPALAELLATYERWGGVIDYALVETTSHLEALRRWVAEREQERWRYTFDLARAVSIPIDLGRFLGDLDLGEGPAYRYAFSKPPYNMSGGGVRHDDAEVEQLFDRLNAELFGIGAELEILQWSTDWSSYFDRGREWWGEYLWTVRSSQRPYIVAIGASATD